MIDALIAVTDTVEPASTPVRSKRTASAASTELSAGTVTEAGVTEDAAVVTAAPFTDSAIVGTAADAEGTERKDPNNAADTTSAAFLIDFTEIYLLISF
jgi:hypothetical protein